MAAAIGYGASLALRQRRTAAVFDFSTGQMPGGATLTRASPATVRDADGVLVLAGVDVPRFQWEGGVLRGLLIEPASTNKQAVVSSNMVDTGGIGRSGGGAGTTLSVVDAAAALNAAGLGALCGNGRAYRLDNVAGGVSAYATVAGVTGNGNPHCFAAHVRLVSGASGAVRNNSNAGATFTNADFQRVSWTKTAPGASEAMWIAAAAGSVVDFVLTTLEEGGAATSVIPVAGAPATRAADLLQLNWADRGVPDGPVTVRYGFDDGSTQDVATLVANGVATVPTGLNRACLRRAAIA